MAAVYSSFRDVSGILTPGAAWLVLFIAPLPGIFVAAGIGLVASWAVASVAVERSDNLYRLTESGRSSAEALRSMDA